MSSSMPPDSHRRGIPDPRFRGQVMALVLVALIVRGAVLGIALNRDDPPLPDSELYRAYASRIAEGEPYDLDGNGALRTPGYPIFIAFCWSIAGSDNRISVLIAQALLGAGTVLLVALMGRRLEARGWPRGTAITSGAIACFEPYGLMLGTLELSETLFTFLMLLSVWTSMRCIDGGEARGTWIASIVAGISAGAAILVRPSALLLVPIAAVGWLMAHSAFRQSWIPLAITLLATLATLSPWWIRNFQRYGAFVPTTLNVGESLYDGLNPRADGGSNMEFKNTLATSGMTEQERDRYWRTEAIDWARANPDRVLSLAFEKLGRFWSPWPNERRFQTPVFVVPTTLYTVPVYLLSAVGLWVSVRGGRPNGVLLAVSLAPILYFAAMHGVFVSSVRYRAVAMPTFVLLAGLGAQSLVRRDQS